VKRHDNEKDDLDVTTNKFVLKGLQWNKV